MEPGSLGAVGQHLEAAAIARDVGSVQDDAFVAKRISLEGSHGLVDGLEVGIRDDDATQHEDRVGRLERRQAVVAGLVEEQMMHGAMLGRRLRLAQSDNQSSTFTPCSCSQAAVASKSGSGGTKMTAPSRPRVSSTR